MNRPVILLDVDGVVADFANATLDAIEDITGRRHALADIKTWEISDALGLTSDEDALLRGMICTKGFCRDLNLIDGAWDGVARLRELGDVYACTSPFDSDYWQREREIWLMEHLGFARNEIISTSAKHICKGDFLIDDKLSTIEIWSRAHGHGVVFDQPWNKDRDPNAYRNYSRAGGWAALTNVVEALWESRW